MVRWTHCFASEFDHAAFQVVRAVCAGRDNRLLRSMRRRPKFPLWSRRRSSWPHRARCAAEAPVRPAGRVPAITRRRLRLRGAGPRAREKVWNEFDPRDLLTELIQTAATVDPRKTCDRLRTVSLKLQKRNLPPDRRRVVLGIPRRGGRGVGPGAA